MAVLDALKNRRDDLLLTPANLRAAMDEVKDIQLDSPLALKTIEEFTEADWQSIAKRTVHTRSAFECQQEWNCFGRPDRNRTPVSRAEAERIQQLAEEHNERNVRSFLSQGPASTA